MKEPTKAPKPEYECDVPVDDPLVVLDLVAPGWNDHTIRTVERWRNRPTHVQVAHVRDFSDTSYLRFLVTDRAVDELKRGRLIAGTPKWGYTEDRELRITELGENRLYEERKRLGEFPAALRWLVRRAS